MTGDDPSQIGAQAEAYGDLPALSHPFVVSQAAIDDVVLKGHTVLRQLATPDEVAAYRPAIEAAALDHAWDTRPLADRDTYGKAFLQSMNLWRVDERVRRFVFSPRFAKAAADLLGVTSVRLYHDQALFKEPGGGHTPWHQDQHYWPLDTDRTITMWMPLVDVPAEVGTMTFASGSHRLGSLGHHGISDESDAAFTAMLAARGLPLETHGALGAGDATFHCGWTLHGAPPNPTDAMRPVMTIIYVADGTRVSAPQSDAQKLDLKVWLPGLRPGDLVDSPINPVLWP